MKPKKKKERRVKLWIQIILAIAFVSIAFLCIELLFQDPKVETTTSTSEPAQQTTAEATIKPTVEATPSEEATTEQPVAENTDAIETSAPEEATEDVTETPEIAE